MHWFRSFYVPLAGGCLVLGVACGPASTGTTGPAAGAPSKPKVLNIGVSTELPVIGVFAGTSTGGWTTLTELHSTGLVTPDAQEPRMTGRLAVSVPSVEDGSISITPNGQMRVVYRLRHGVTWQDGAPFTAQDLVFTQTFLFDKNLPVVLRDSAKQVASIEAPDDFTAVFTFAQPYSLGGSLGVRDYWPQPRHLLQEPYDRYQASGSSDEVVNLPYWTSAYVGLGPFRVTTFDPGEGVTMQAYDGFFLGRPKVDTVNVRPFRDENTLFANVLAGAIDVFPEPALHPEFADDLKRWEAESLGTIHTLPGTTSFLAPQWRPEVQKEPANLDVHVRQALYQAIDRDAFPPGLVQQAWALLPPGHPLYDATKDALKRYPYDRVRARALLDEAGWTMAPDGLLRNNTDGRKFQNRISTVATGRQWEVATYADAWRKVGIETEEALVPAAQSRDLQFRALYPSWEASSSAYGDGILGRLTGPAASPENRWAGNRGGYDDPAAQLLIARYYASISDKDQLQVMHELSDLVVSQLPLLISYYGTYYNGVRKGVTALNDAYGKQDTSARNSHLWDVTS